jgi:hypothetical protein
MKKVLFVFLVLTLTACGAAPAGQPAQPVPSQTPVVIVETVVVTAVPNDAQAVAPEATLPPATLPPAATEAAPAAAGGPIKLDDVLGLGWFINMTRDRNDFSLRCQLNPAITFSVQAVHPDISQVEFYYRIEDRSTGAYLDWTNAGKMIPAAAGVYSLTMKGEDVHQNFRKANAWFDYQYVGTNATGAVGRSEKITRQVTFTLECP